MPVTRPRVRLCLLAAPLALAGGLAPVEALELTMPAPVVALESRAEPMASLVLPTGPFAEGQLPGRRVEGALDQRAWTLEARGQSTAALTAPLRADLEAQGYKVIYDCETRACGGFDFRFAIDVMPEPAMHVDLGDFRYLTAEKGAEVVTLLVSRSPSYGFVQMTRIATNALPPPEGLPELPGPVAPVAPGAPVNPSADPPPQPPADLAGQLQALGGAALDDLVFASGSAALEDGDYASLLALADWLAADPARRIALVGHTDASGGLAANVQLSKKRAEAVRQVLLTRHDVAPGQVIAEGVGPLAPRATNLTEEGRTRNRRVEAIVTSTQ